MAENPGQEEFLKRGTSVGPYTLVRYIGRGGMGEVLLAYDSVCEREVALKRIRPELKNHPLIRNRFLREAKITSQLTHPGIISIYSIHQEEDQIYYTMPFVAGETLKQILRYEQKKTIPALMPIFWSICQTVAYIHSKGIIHRDLKPENILVGKFGEVIILDWGLAMIMEGDLENSFEEGKEESSELTHPGKIVGTLAYMAPERALKSLVSYQTDIYALGVILYQILTLHLPFERVSIKEFRKKHHLEKLIEPEELAPYRDVPPRLSRIVKKCLDPFQENRYQTMESMIYDLKNHLEGRSEWFEKARLHTQRKKDWEFQENILISKHIALTRTTEAAEWFSVMLSRMAFAENTRLETKIYLGERSEGIGFLLSVPESEEREHPLKGYCLWLGTEENPYSLLFRNTIEVMHIPDIFLKKNCWHLLALEKIDNHIHFFLNNSHRFTYVSYLPLMGTHVGIIAQDADYLMEEIIVSIGGQNLQVSCLSIPDAFLANKDYKHALAEYRRIGYSFPGHAEGREALFRAGITLLEQAKNAKSEKKAQIFFAASLEEFAKLHTTPGAPLEYLGKSLVYEALKENIEEIKCLEFALRRYHKHPLIGAIKEQIVYRMHESSQNDRKSAYQLILISLRQLPEIIARTDFQRLLKHLTSHWESLPFLEQPADPSLFGKEKSEYERKVHEIQFCVPLAFWLTASHTLLEIYHDLCHLFPLDVSALGNLFYVFFELGSHRLAETFMDQMESNKEQMPPEILKDFEEMMALFDPLRICHRNSLEEGLKSFFKLNPKDIGIREFRTLSYLLQHALNTEQEEKVHWIAEALKGFPLSLEDQIMLDSYRIWAFLQEENWKEAGLIFEKYSLELLNQESTLLHSLYGCWLMMTEGEEISLIHFAGVIDTPFPRTWALLSHELTNRILDNPAWINASFLWERRHLFRQLTLFYQCAENPEKEAYFRQLERKEYVVLSD